MIYLSNPTKLFLLFSSFKDFVDSFQMIHGLGSERSWDTR
jgi:hypothetical protein